MLEFIPKPVENNTIPSPVPKGFIVENPKNHNEIAQDLIANNFSGDVQGLRHFDRDFWVYRPEDGTYQRMPDTWMEDFTARVLADSLYPPPMKKGDEETDEDPHRPGFKHEVPLPVTAGLSNSVAQLVRAHAHTPILTCPGYVGIDPRYENVMDLLPCRNGILSITRLLNAEHPLLPRTPDFITDCRLQVAYDPQARCPTFDWWINDVMNGDEEAITFLKRWAGYQLVADTRFHIVVLFQGTTQDGKGTFNRQIDAIMGRYRSTADFNQLVSGYAFAMEHLLHARSNVISEIPDNPSAKEMGAFGHLLKQFSGESPVTVNRKNRTAVARSLDIRTTLEFNSTPAFPDNNGAFLGRCRAIHFPNSYLGREDFTLEPRMRAEGSGILNWMLDGLFEVFTVANPFQQPAQGEQIISRMIAASAPIKQFAYEFLDLGADNWCLKDEMRQAVKLWASREGIKWLGDVSASKCTKLLQDWNGSIKVGQKTIKGEHAWIYMGVALNNRARKLLKLKPTGEGSFRIVQSLDPEPTT